MESFVFSREVLISGGAILVVLIFFLYHRLASPTKDRTDFTEPARVSVPVGRVPEYKDEYTDELSRATLFLDGGEVKLTFSDISDVEVDDTLLEVTLKKTTGKSTFLSLGTYDLLVAQGEPVACEVHEAYKIRVWALEKLVYNESLADVEFGEGYLTGYTDDGSDVCLVFGTGLTLCAEEI